MQRCTFLNYVIKNFKSCITGEYQLQMQVASTGKKKKKKDIYRNEKSFETYWTSSFTIKCNGKVHFICQRHLLTQINLFVRSEIK